MKIKLQIFISSTYSDLIEERQAAVSAILKAGHIPAGMELFTSADDILMNDSAGKIEFKSSGEKQSSALARAY